MCEILRLDHCSVAFSFYSLVKVLSVFFSALLMYWLDMAEVQGDVVNICIKEENHKRKI